MQRTTDINHFQPAEFQGWYKQLNSELLCRLNAFRDYWGKPVHVSPHPDAVGRNLGNDSQSSHNIDYWGEVNAVDVFPEGMHTSEDLTRAYDIAVACGFTGIGLYTDTEFRNKKHPMLHGDVRPTRLAGNPATWSRVNGEYGDINNAIHDLEAFEEASV